MSQNFTNQISNGDWFGIAITGIGDLNGDGIDDLVVSAPQNDLGASNAGAIWVLFMNSDSTIKSHKKIGSQTGGLSATLPLQGYFGVSVAYLGDLDNDGNIEIAVGNPYKYGSGNSYGIVWILSLDNTRSVVKETKIGAGFGGFSGNSASDDFGYSVANAGDVDGDGVNDLLVGAWADNSRKGAVYVLLLNSNGTVKSYTKINDGSTGFASLDAGDEFGSSVSAIGDLNNNGRKEIAVGAIGDDDGGTNRGAVYVLFLDSAGNVNSYTKLSSSGLPLSSTLSDNDAFGWTVAEVGDLNNDGVPDLAVGAPLDDDAANDGGAIYLLYLNTNGTVGAVEKIGAARSDLNMTLDDLDEFGRGLYYQKNSSGKGTFYVGAKRDDDGGTDRGAVHVLNVSHPSTGIYEGSKHLVKLYPIPATDYIKISSPVKVRDLILLDMMGKEIMHLKDINTDDYVLPVQSLSAGIYILKLEGPNYRITRKVIKE